LKRVTILSRSEFHKGEPLAGLIDMTLFDAKPYCLHPALACAPPLPIIEAPADDPPRHEAVKAANDNGARWPLMPFPDGWYGSN
jgi:hypothetical protein